MINCFNGYFYFSMTTIYSRKIVSAINTKFVFDKMLQVFKNFIQLDNSYNKNKISKNHKFKTVKMNIMNELLHKNH